jgi:hypothetical protein
VTKQLPVAGARAWRGITPPGLPVVRLALYTDCAWLQMDAAHGPGAPPGYPRVLAERLVEHGLGLEVSVIVVQQHLDLPTNRAELLRHVRLSGPPDVVLLQTPGLYWMRRVLPPGRRVDPLRWAFGRRLGDRALTASRLGAPIVARIGKPVAAYPGAQRTERLLLAAAECWPEAIRAVLAPMPLLVERRGSRQQQAQIRFEARAACGRTGTAYLNFDDQLLASAQRVHCANGYNLNAHGSRLVGETLAGWLLDVAEGGLPRLGDREHEAHGK